MPEVFGYKITDQNYETKFYQADRPGFVGDNLVLYDGQDVIVATFSKGSWLHACVGYEYVDLQPQTEELLGCLGQLSHG